MHTHQERKREKHYSIEIEWHAINQIGNILFTHLKVHKANRAAVRVLLLHKYLLRSFFSCCVSFPTYLRIRFVHTIEWVNSVKMYDVLFCMAFIVYIVSLWGFLLLLSRFGFLSPFLSTYIHGKWETEVAAKSGHVRVQRTFAHSTEHSKSK